jgi:hypothetical protein
MGGRRVAGQSWVPRITLSVTDPSPGAEGITMWLGIIRTVARRAVLGTVVASVAVAGLLAPAQAGAPTAPFDHAGDDVGEAIAAADQETCDGVPTHEIGAVQGSGDASPIAGRQVTVRGVVVGDVPGFSGFYL